LSLGLAACARGGDEPGAGAQAAERGLAPRRVADMIHEVLAADREVYTKEIVQRLTIQQKVQVAPPGGGAAGPLDARQAWPSEHAKLPPPAQMFRMGAEKVLSAGTGFSYLLLSPWPINKQNRARTDVERSGLEQVAQKAEPYYTNEDLGGKRYFV